LILHFHFHNYMFEYLLPPINDRRIRVNLNEELEEGYGSVNLEVWNHEWHMLPAEDTTLTYKSKQVFDHVLKSGDIINGRVTNSNMAFAVRVSPVDESFTNYQKFSIAGLSSITIGGDSSSHVKISDEYVSRHHAVLQTDGSGMVISDYSTNGTYVGNRRLESSRKLEMMDDIRAGAYPRLGVEYYDQGLDAFNASDYYLALELLEQAFYFLDDEATQWNELLFMLGSIYYNQGRNAEAEVLLLDLQERAPNHRAAPVRNILASIEDQS